MFNYMIQDGLRYGCLTIGVAYVFVKVELDYDNQTNSTTATAFFHVAEPKNDVAAHGGDLNHSAVMQVATFVLGAVDECSREGQIAKIRRADWAKKLPYWRTSPDGDWSIPAAEFEAERRPLMRPERNTNDEKFAAPPKPLYTEFDYEENAMGGSKGSKRQRQRAPVVRRGPRTRSQTKAAGANDFFGIRTIRERQYCTPKCLLGLITGDLLDEKCPNVDLHRRTRTGNHHPVDYTTWLDLLRRQLKKGMVDGFDRFQRYYDDDESGYVFRVTLLAYGYTFFGKGANDDRAGKLVFEADVYKRLRPIQGVYVPVFLGEIDMVELGDTYVYGIGIRLTYFLFMSWGGHTLDDEDERRNEKVSRELRNALQAIHEQGVVHTDVRPTTVLWDDKTERVTIVDFAEAILEKQPRPDLAPFILVPKKRGTHGRKAEKSTRTGDEMELKINPKWLDLQLTNSASDSFSL